MCTCTKKIVVHNVHVDTSNDIRVQCASACIHNVSLSLSLSLLHSELSEVLWLMVINMAIGLAVQNNSAPIGAIVLFFLFAFWAGKCI